MTISELRLALEELEKDGLGNEEIVVGDMVVGDLSKLECIGVIREPKLRVIAEYTGFEV